MKKILLGLLLVLATAASAADWRVQSFLAADVTSLCVSNKSLGITNFYWNAGQFPSNVVSTTWTNGQGTRIVTAGTSDVQSYKQLLNDVTLPSTAEATPVLISDGAAGQVTNYANCSIFIRILGQSGANSAVNFYFYPVPDGDSLYADVETTQNLITVAVTATASGYATILAPVPLYKVLGCQKLRCWSINNTDTDATSRIDITDFKLVGVPH